MPSLQNNKLESLGITRNWAADQEHPTRLTIPKDILSVTSALSWNGEQTK